MRVMVNAELGIWNGRMGVGVTSRMRTKLSFPKFPIGNLNILRAHIELDSLDEAFRELVGERFFYHEGHRGHEGLGSEI